MVDSVFKPTVCKTILHVLAGFSIWLGCQIFSNIAYMIPQPVVALFVAMVIQVVSVYLFLSLYCRKVLHMEISECRVNKTPPCLAWILCAILLPVLVSGWFLLFVPGKFSHNVLPRPQFMERIAIAVFATCIAAGITEEMVFRGFVMRLIEARGGRIWAVLIPSVAFAAFHLLGVQPKFLDIAQLMIAGTSVGVMFSLICYQSDSIWSGAVVHGIWNLIVIGGILDIGTNPSGTSIFTYTIATDSQLLTGGSFGIEASLPAVVGYWAVIAMALLLSRRKRPCHGKQC